MADMVTRQELEAAKVDVKHAGEAVNTKKVITPRYGNSFKSIPLLSEELQQILNNKDMEAGQKLQVLQDVMDIALAAGAGAAGWTASLVAGAGGKNQQEINDFGGAEWWPKPGGYKLGATVKLANGDIVKSTEPNNTKDPNLDMTGWENPQYGDFSFAQKWGVIGDGNHYTLSDLWTDTPRRKFQTLAQFQAYYSTTEDASSTQSIDFFLLQYAIDQLSAIYLSRGIVQTLILQGNKTYIGRGLFSKAGVNIIAYNGFATLKKRPALALTENDVKTWRVLETDRTGVSFQSELGRKHRIIIKDVIVDGNQSAMNWTTNTYNQEQAMSIILGIPTHASMTTTDNRCKYKLINVFTKDSVSDGLCVYRNCDIQFDILNASNCFRGGLTVAGGNNIINGDKYIGDKARFDTEVDLSGAGYGSSLANQIDINYMEIDKNGSGYFGGADLEVKPGSVTNIRVFRCYSSPITLNTVSDDARVNAAPKGQLIIEDWYSESDSIYAYGWPQRTHIKKATIIYKPNSWRNFVGSANYTGAIVCLIPTAAAGNWYGYKDRQIVMDNPVFILDKSLVPVEDTREFYAVHNRSDYSNNGNKVELNNPNFGTGFDAGVRYNYGGTVAVKDGHCDAKYFVWVYENIGEASKGTYNTFDVTIEGIPKFGANCLGLLQMGLVNSASLGNNASILRFKNFTVPYEFAGVTASGVWADVRLEGNRRIIKKDNGLAITGARSIGGDILEYRLPDIKGVKSYIVNAAGFVSDTTQFKPFERVEISASKTYDPLSVGVGLSVSTNVTLTGVAVGDFVRATFTQYHADIEISAVVSAMNNVTVKFKNTGASAVDLADGILTVKLV